MNETWHKPFLKILSCAVVCALILTMLFNEPLRASFKFFVSYSDIGQIGNVFFALLMISMYGFYFVFREKKIEWPFKYIVLFNIFYFGLTLLGLIFGSLPLTIMSPFLFVFDVVSLFFLKDEVKEV